MSRSPAKPLRIAIVEDRPNQAELLRRRLKAQPGVGSILHYLSAEEALAGIFADPPDVVFMDVNLPGLSGLECTRRLKARLPELRIIIITVHDERDILDQALKNGADGYLTKPVRPADVAAAIGMLRSGLFPLTQGMVGKLVSLARERQGFTPDTALTPRENEIMARVVSGGTDKELATHFQVAPTTISRHLHNIYAKLGVTTRTEAVAKLCGLAD
ncbi:MAG: DNA-binding response regulator [Proteobacteria bacterium]|nr:DNA-binding response regulator [Pseudomonadota bacterium]